MAQVTQRVCDRCGSKVEDSPDSAPKRLTRYDTDYHGTRVDLCTPCAEEFKAWLDDPAVTRE